MGWGGGVGATPIVPGPQCQTGREGCEKGGKSGVSGCTSHLSDTDGGEFNLTRPRVDVFAPLITKAPCRLARQAGRIGVRCAYSGGGACCFSRFAHFAVVRPALRSGQRAQANRHAQPHALSPTTRGFVEEGVSDRPRLSPRVATLVRCDFGFLQSSPCLFWWSLADDAF